MSEPAAIPLPFPADILEAFPAEDLLAGLFATALSALLLLRPVHGADETIIDFRLELLSEAAQRMMQLPARPGRTYLEVAPGTQALGILDFYRAVYERNEPGRREFSYQLDGFDGYYRLAARRVGAGLLVCFTDSNDEPRTPMEVALRESQAREQDARAATERERANLRAMLDQAPVAMAVFEGPERRILVANERMAALWGRPLAEVLHRPLLEALPELRGQGFDTLIAEVMASGEAYAGTEAPAQMWRDGAMQTTYYNFVYQPLFDEQGRVRGVVDVATEVTEQVLTRQQIEAKERQTNILNEELAAANEKLQAANEEVRANNDSLFHAQMAVRELNTQLELRVSQRTLELTNALAETEQQREHLRQQQQALRHILEQVPAAVATLEGPEHRFAFFNARYQALVGGRAQVGRTVAEALPEVVSQGFIELLDGTFATGETFMGVEMLTLLYDPATGQPERRYLDFTYQLLPAAPSQPRSLLAFVVDTTTQVLGRQQVADSNEHLLAANAALDLSNRRLTRTNADLDNFVYAASHDLKQPINNLLGLLDELRRTVAFADPAEGELLLPMIDDSLHQLGTTVDDLAAVGQVQQAGSAPTETVDLAELTQEVLQALQPQVLAARARVTTDFAAAPTVSYSRANLRTILLNLIGNSLKYADPARPGRIHLSLWKEAGAPLLLVEDNGLGFDVHRHQDELFQLFRRFHTHIEGTGVGLYLVNRIVQGNGGRVEVESEIGQGTTFRVYL
ncbi:PAS domain-containing protein [Hymenobacter sp. UYCo722]|uniref:PAS domain-containing protein n=1 Tax=Hymenobacter sp. UYCo722 TaxID=3156335 RepID=UPI00339A272D